MDSNSICFTLAKKEATKNSHSRSQMKKCQICIEELGREEEEGRKNVIPVILK